MKRNSHEPVLVVGIGNTDRGDDGAGIYAARYLRAKGLPFITVNEQTGESSDLIDLWQTVRVPAFYLIDAMVSDLLPGAIRRFEVQSNPLPVLFMGDYSTHSCGLAYAVELARVLGFLPPQLIVYGIVGKCFDPGSPLSVEVQEAAVAVSQQIIIELYANS